MTWLEEEAKKRVPPYKPNTHPAYYTVSEARKIFIAGARAAIEKCISESQKWDLLDTYPNDLAEAIRALLGEEK